MKFPFRIHDRNVIDLRDLVLQVFAKRKCNGNIKECENVRFRPACGSLCQTSLPGLLSYLRDPGNEVVAGRSAENSARKSEKSAALFLFFRGAPQLTERLEEASPVEDLEKVLHN